MREKYLPVGSVVLLKEAQDPLMIVGFSSIDEDEPNKVYDYSGCDYPEGMVDYEEVELFQHEDIEKILFLGYETEESKRYDEEVKKTTEEYLNSNIKRIDNNLEIEDTDEEDDDDEDFFDDDEEE